MSLQRTNLVLSSTPLAADFSGDVQALFAAMVSRLKILSPTGSTLFQTGDVEPVGNQGPWLKDGSAWWVYDEVTGRYAPADISDSAALPFWLQNTTPAGPTGSEPLVWMQTFNGRIIGLYGWNGAVWRKASVPPATGTTAARPSDPQDLEQYWDTDIHCLIHFERGSWRTVAGTPGDAKFVVLGLLEDAIRTNPGWVYVGEFDPSVRGRAIGIATKDTSGLNAVYTPDTGLTARAAGATAGSETVVLGSADVEQHTHVIGHAEALHFDNNAIFQRADDGETISVPSPQPPNQFLVKGDGTSDGSQAGEAGSGLVGTSLLTSRQLPLATQPNYTGVADAHENTTPTLYLWCLVKT